MRLIRQGRTVREAWRSHTRTNCQPIAGVFSEASTVQRSWPMAESDRDCPLVGHRRRIGCTSVRSSRFALHEARRSPRHWLTGGSCLCLGHIGGSKQKFARGARWKLAALIQWSIRPDSQAPAGVARAGEGPGFLQAVLAQGGLLKGRGGRQRRRSASTRQKKARHLAGFTRAHGSGDRGPAVRVGRLFGRGPVGPHRRVPG